MSGQYGAFRFGWDGPNRISTSTVMLQEQTELVPSAVLHDMIPFVPPITNGDGSTTGSDIQLSEDGHPIWSRVPAPVDLIFYQGDDVVIPLYFNDPSLLGDDMEENFEWFSQVRLIHSYKSTLVNTFSIKASYHPSAAVPPSEADEYTVVELFLPRSENIYRGCYRWELYSISPQDYTRFPKPDDVDAADWPPLDGLRTWLYGNCTIVPRTTTTDWLPAPPGTVPAPGPVTPAITSQGWVVGPNGRVP
jgi:hypothetical protein